MALNPTRPSSMLPPLAGVGLFLSLVWGGLLAFVQHDRALVEEAAYREAENYSIAFEEYTHNIITTVDNSLRYLSQLYVQSRLRGQPMDQVLLEGYAPIKTFQFAIIGPDGIMTYSNLAPARNRVDLSDREHFRVHLDPGQDRLFISRPVLGRVSGKWSIQFTRKVVMPDGSFGGVLVLSVEKTEFERFFHRLDLGQRGLIALFGTDGWMRARGSQVEETVHDSMKEPLPPERPYFRPGGPERSRIRLIGYFDGVDRIGAYRRVRDVPLLVSAQLAVDEVFANHADRARRAMVAGLILTVATLAGLAILAVLRRQRDAALREAAASEERWHLAVDAVGDGVWDWNPLTKDAFFSHRMAEIVGRTPESLPRTVPEWMEIIHPDDRDGVAAAFDAFMRGEPRFSYEYRSLHGDGGYVWVLDRAVAAERDEQGRPLRVIGLRADVSDRRRLQDELARQAVDLEHARLRERMEEANRLESLGTLAGGIAHEINTPAQYVGDNLTFLESCVPDLLKVADAAERHCPPECCPELTTALAAANLDFLRQEVPDAIAQGLEGVRRIAKIVQAVKEFCYPSSREPQPCDLGHLIESAATVTRNAWKYCSELTLDLEPDLPPVLAIEGEINQMLVNLIVNAAQAIAEKKAPTPGTITIRTRRVGDAVSFAVADDGIGIPADRHKRIFELFYTTKPPGQGTGQGLAITAAIVRRHGGGITVDSEPGQGACFTVTLPVNGPIGEARGPAVAQ